MATHKNKPKPSNMVVDFTTLDDHNKTEFLEFLLKNNISFEKDSNHKHQDFVAKVTIDNKGILKPDNIKKNTLTTPKNSTNKKPYKPNAKTQKQNTFTPTKTPQKQRTLSNKKQNKKQINNKSFQHQKNWTEGKQRKTTSQFITQKNGTKPAKVTAQKKEQKQAVKTILVQNPKSDKSAKKENKSKTNIEVKKKTHDEKQISQLVNKYLKVFELRLNGQRPIKWTIIQINKYVQEIYNQIFDKTTQQLVTGKKSGTSPSFIKSIKDYFHEKFKSEKLGNSNLINFIHSMCYHLQKQKETNKNQINKAPMLISIQIFQEFISQIYQQQDLLFFLFVRNIINKKSCKKGKKLKTEISLGKHIQNNVINEDKMFLNSKDISKIVSELVGEDQELIREYKAMILNEIKNRQINWNGNVRVSYGQFLRIVVQDYRNKRILGEEYSSIQTNRNNQRHVNGSVDHNHFSNDIFIKQNAEKLIYEQQELQLNQKKYQMFREPTLGKLEQSADQLTFGQDTHDKNELMFQQNSLIEEARQFWDSKKVGSYDADPTTLEGMICEKLQKKVGELISIVIESQNQFISEETIMIKDIRFSQQKITFLEKIVNSKAYNLMNCIFSMDKMRWFQELKVQDPSFQDIENVEKLQLAYRSLKNNLDAKMIGELCKNILTIPQFTQSLENLLL